MATIEETIFARCTTHAGISALIDARCYPERLPENVTYPALVYTRISSSAAQFRTHELESVGLDDARFQFDSYAETSKGAKDLADQVFAAWDGYRDECVVGYARQVNRRATRQDSINVYREISDVMMIYST